MTPADAEHDASVIVLVGKAAADLPREELAGQVVSDWSLALAIISTLMLLALMRTWLPQRRQHPQHHAPGAAAVPEDDLAKEMMPYLVVNLNKIVSFCSRACGKEGTAKKQLTAHSAQSLSVWVGGRAGLRQGPSSLNPAGVNGLIPAKQCSHEQGASPGAHRLSRGGVRTFMTYIHDIQWAAAQDDL